MGAKLFTSRAAAGGPALGLGSTENQPRSRSLGRLYEAAALLLFTGAAFSQSKAPPQGVSKEWHDRYVGLVRNTYVYSQRILMGHVPIIAG